MNLQEVENAISVMNQAAFQELGDLFMISKNRDYSVYGENTTFGDIEAAKWSSLLSCLENVTTPKVYSIRAKIKRYIISCQRQADDERARNQLFR